MGEAGELTAELRFWWRGEAPAAVSSWFEAGRTGEPKTRTDTYLLAGNAALGIKRRGQGGGIEIKSLVAVLDRGLSCGAVGMTPELWLKCEAETGDLLPARPLAVTKTRRLRRFVLHGERVVETGEAEDADCEVEFGTVQPDEGEQWSSLCFEARATLDDPAGLLRGVWTALDPPTECAGALAASYPAWLEHHARAWPNIRPQPAPLRPRAPSPRPFRRP